MYVSPVFEQPSGIPVAGVGVRVLRGSIRQVNQFEAQALWRPFTSTFHLNNLAQPPLELGALRARQTRCEVCPDVAADLFVGLAVQVGPQALEQLAAVDVAHHALFGGALAA